MPSTSTQRAIGRVSVVTPPASAPIAVGGDGGAKGHLRVPHNADDTEIERAILAAVGEIDAPYGWLGRSLMPRTLRLTIDGPPPSVIYLPGPPVTAVKTIKVRESDDTITTIYDDDAGTDEIGLITDLIAEPALIWPDDDYGWPSDIKGGVDSMRIDYEAGYTDADSVPAVIRQWLLMRIGELYRDPEASMLGVTSTRLHHADRMLDNWRVRF